MSIGSFDTFFDVCTWSLLPCAWVRASCNFEDNKPPAAEFKPASFSLESEADVWHQPRGKYSVERKSNLKWLDLFAEVRQHCLILLVSISGVNYSFPVDQSSSRLWMLRRRTIWSLVRCLSLLQWYRQLSTVNFGSFATKTDEDICYANYRVSDNYQGVYYWTNSVFNAQSPVRSHVRRRFQVSTSPTAIRSAMKCES